MQPLYNDCREVMLKDGHERSAALIDALYHYNFNPGEKFTHKQAENLSPDKGLCFSDYFVRHALEDRTIFACEIMHSGKRGRPTAHYTVPDRDALRERFVPEKERGLSFADPLPEWAFTSLRDYRLGILQAFYLRRAAMFENKDKNFTGFPCAIGVLADMVGVCKRTARNYKKVLQMISEEQFKVELVTEHNVDRVPERAKQGAQYLCTGKFDEVAAGEGFKAPLKRSIARRWLEMGIPVYWVVQTASKIYIPHEAALYCGAGQYEDWSGKVIAPTWGMECAA